MVLFERSIEEQKLDKKSYKTYIDDGDNKVYSVVVNSLPYGGGGGGGYRRVTRRNVMPTLQRT